MAFAMYSTSQVTHLLCQEVLGEQEPRQLQLDHHRPFVLLIPLGLPAAAGAAAVLFVVMAVLDAPVRVPVREDCGPRPVILQH